MAENNDFLLALKIAMETVGMQKTLGDIKNTKAIINSLNKSVTQGVSLYKTIAPSLSTPFQTLGDKVKLVTFVVQKANKELAKMRAFIDSGTGNLMKVTSEKTSFMRSSSLRQAPVTSEMPQVMIPRVSPTESLKAMGLKPYDIDMKEQISKVYLYGEALNKVAESSKRAATATGGLDFSISKMIKKSATIVPIWMAIRAIYMSFINLVKDNIQFLEEWDSTLAKISVVGTGSAEQLSKLSKELLNLGTAYGVSLEDLGEGSRLWAQQGKSYKDIVPLMETTTRMSMITGRSVGESVEDLTSIMYSFGKSVEDTTHIIDAITAVDMKYAITTDVMVSAIRKVGPVADQMNISFEKLLGIITATHLSTRASGEEIGNAWKTIFTRMATSSKEAIQSLAQIPIYFDEINKTASFKNTGSFREWEDILNELAIKYETLSETAQSQLAYELAGTRQITKLQAAFKQWKESLDVVNTAQNSNGASLAAVAKLQDTVENKTKRLTNAWHEMANALSLDLGITAVWKTMLDIMRGMVDALTQWTALGGANSFLGIAGKVTQKIAQKGVFGLVGETILNTAKSAEDDKNKKKDEENAKKVRSMTKEDFQLELDKIDAQKEYGVRESSIIKQKIDKINLLREEGVSIDENLQKELDELETQKEIVAEKEKYEDFLNNEEIVEKRLAGMGYNKIDIASKLLKNKQEYLQAQGKDITNNKQIIDQQKEILSLIQEEINTYSSGLQDTLSGGLTDFLKGESTLSEFGDSVAASVKNSILSNFSQGVIEKLFTTTGMGKVFGENIFQIRHLFEKSPRNLYEMLQRGFRDGGDYAADAIRKAFVTGANQITSGTSGLGLTGASSALSKSSKSGGFLDNLASMFGGFMSSAGSLASLFGGGGTNAISSSFTSAGGFTGSGYQQTSLIGSLGSSSSLYDNDAYTKSLLEGVGSNLGSSPAGKESFLSGLFSGLSGGSGLGSMAGLSSMFGNLGAIGLGGYSAYKSSGGGTLGGFSAGLSTVGGIVSMVPGGQAIGGILSVGSMLLGLFKKSVTVQEETRTETKQISTKIQVSNKELSVVNRNLVALRQEKTFILPESAYFSTKNTIEDEFALHSSRGLA